MIVIAEPTGGADVHGVGRLAGDLDAVGAAGLGGLRPVGSQVAAQAGDVFDDIPPDPRVAPERIAAMADDPRSCVTRVTVIPNRWAPGPGDAA